MLYACCLLCFGVGGSRDLYSRMEAVLWALVVVRWDPAQSATRAGPKQLLCVQIECSSLMLQMDGYYAVGYTDGSPLRLCTARTHNSSDGCVGGWVGGIQLFTWFTCCFDLGSVGV